MELNRREFLSAAAVGVAAGLLATRASGRPPGVGKIRAVLFDAFPVFDPAPVPALAETLFPGHGRALTDLWRARQFEYTWLRTLARTYVDFEQTTRDALVYAIRALKLNAGPVAQDQLVGAFSRLSAWPDVLPALTALQRDGIRLGFLSNFTTGMLQSNIRNSGLDGLFEHVLSTDRVRAFKPDPRAYEMGVEAFGLERGEIAFAAFAGWDAAGATSFGYPTFWVNRLKAPTEELGVTPDASGSLADLVGFVRGSA